MATTRSFRQGQVEVGVIENNGVEYAAYGATVCGREISAYLKFKRGHYWLTTWSGGTMLDARSEIVERFWNGGMAILFRLPKRRFVVGYALGNEMLFRGELLDGCNEDDARRHAMMLSQNWSEVDAEDEEAELAEV